MEPESMVHALEKIHGLLAVRNGRLIDIHPIGQPPPIFVRLDDARHLTGWILEESDYVSYAQAEAALQEAVQRGWFWRQQRQRLTFATYADQLEELRNYLETTWLEARIEELVAMEIENQLSRLAHQKELIVEEQIWMSRYQPIFH